MTRLTFGTISEGHEPHPLQIPESTQSLVVAPVFPEG